MTFWIPGKFVEGNNNQVRLRGSSFTSGTFVYLKNFSGMFNSPGIAQGQVMLE